MRVSAALLSGLPAPSLKRRLSSELEPAAERRLNVTFWGSGGAARPGELARELGGEGD